MYFLLKLQYYSQWALIANNLIVKNSIIAEKRQLLLPYYQFFAIFNNSFWNHGIYHCNILPHSSIFPIFFSIQMASDKQCRFWVQFFF